jgi:uncharacterized protein (DUF736 family)
LRKAGERKNFPACGFLARQIFVPSGLFRCAPAFGAHRFPPCHVNDHRNHQRGVTDMTTTNYIQFDADDLDAAKGKGLISTIERDLDIAAVPFSSDNEKAPTHRVYAKSPRGHDIEVGGIWKKKNAEGKPYYTLSIKRLSFNANLGRFPGQDDPTLQAIIEWEPRD